MIRLNLSARLTIAAAVLTGCVSNANLGQKPSGGDNDSEGDASSDTDQGDTDQGDTESADSASADTVSADTDQGTEGSTAGPGRCTRIVPEAGTSMGVQWAFHCTTAAMESVIGAGVDASNNVLFGFTFRGWDDTAGQQLEIGDRVIDHVDGAETILVKLDLDGELLWTRLIDGPGNQWLEFAGACGDTLVVQLSGDPGTLDQDGSPLPEGHYLAAFGPDGELRWTHAIPVQEPDGHMSVFDLACDSQGNLYAAGRFRDGIDLGDGMIPGAVSDGWIASFDADGEHRWSRSISSRGSSAGVGSLDLTPDGGVVVAGSFDDTIDLGNGERTADFGEDVFVARYDGDGNPLWDLQIGPDGLQYAGGVAVAPDGTLALTGIFLDSIELGPDGYSNVFPDQIPDEHGTNYDAFISRLDANGNYLWSEHVGTMLNDELGQPAFAPDGALIIPGSRTDGPFFAMYVGQEAMVYTPLPASADLHPIGDQHLLLSSNVGGETVDLLGVELEGLGGTDALVARLIR